MFLARLRVDVANDATELTIIRIVQVTVRTLVPFAVVRAAVNREVITVVL